LRQDIPHQDVPSGVVLLYRLYMIDDGGSVTLRGQRIGEREAGVVSCGVDVRSSAQQPSGPQRRLASTQLRR
jgi:hypothetical protein